MNKKKITILIIILMMILILTITNNKHSETILTYYYNPINNETYHKVNSIENYKKEYNNKDIIGKIKIKGTSINEIVVQGKDNEYYLNHSIDKKKSDIGSIFMDYRNTPKDRKVLIYGHNSETSNLVVFKELEKYLDKNFYIKNKYINLNLNNSESIWEIFSIMIILPDDYTHMEITFNDNDWVKHISWMKKNSIYDTNVNVDINDKIITLQTCYYEPSNSYIIINAKKIR